ncbi:MAG TPA: hypothetical protein VEV87_08595 [Chitinophagaceae bacterium]|nr:hypothetical protein [Chitinophagaceae bacterium]
MPSAKRIRFWFWLLLFLNILFIAGAKYYLAPLTSGEIVRFETAKYAGKAQVLIDEWHLTGKLEKVSQSIWIDYVFILLYVCGLMAAVMHISDVTHHPLLVRSGRFFRWLIPIAGICDMLENIFMQQTLRTQPTAFTVMLTYDMAVAKFSILIVTFLFLVLCLFFWIIRKLFPAVA